MKPMIVHQRGKDENSGRISTVHTVNFSLRNLNFGESENEIFRYGN